MKRHVQEDHEGANALNHLKMDRDDISKVSYKIILRAEVPAVIPQCYSNITLPLQAIY